jgi:hypothetical protein
MVRTTPSPSCCSTSNVRPFSAKGAAFLDQGQRLVDARHAVARKLDVDHSADALDDLAFAHLVVVLMVAFL